MIRRSFVAVGWPPLAAAVAVVDEGVGCEGKHDVEHWSLLVVEDVVDHVLMAADAHDETSVACRGEHVSQTHFARRIPLEALGGVGNAVDSQPVEEDRLALALALEMDVAEVGRDIGIASAAVAVAEQAAVEIVVEVPAAEQATSR